jgi:hypothetical protein
MSNVTTGRAESRPISGIAWRVAAALLTGGVTYLITNLINLGQIWTLTLSAFIGGVVLVVQFLAKFEDRLMAVEEEQTQRLKAMEESHAAHAQEIRELVQDGFSKVNRAGELFGLFEASAIRPDPVIELVQHSASLAALTADVPSLVSQAAEAEILRTSRFLKELSGGTTSYDGEDRDWLLTLARHATVSIDATSLNTVDARGNGIDSSFWRSDLGQRYLKVQRGLAQRGVKIRRIFIVDHPTVADSPDFLAMCRKQALMQIKVRVLDHADYEELFDFVLFDKTIMYETTPASFIHGASPPGILHTQLQWQPDVVRKRVEQYNDLWESARPFAAD